jgi:selenide,water dikinase
VLGPIQNIFNPQAYPDLLVGLGMPDDAAVWQMDDERALVVTTDFFTPIVDDAYDYGAIAAANALSDLYAMGASPFMALNIAAMPPDLPLEILTEIMRGGAEKVREAGAVIAGGHTVQDKEPKYGLVAIGMCKIDQLMTKANAKPGDLLVLTKPLGVGVTTTALKRGTAEADDVEQAVAWMTRLNGPASRLALEFGVRAATDVTGFSLLGHSVEMAEASCVSLTFNFHSIPFLSGSRRYAEGANFPGGSADNRLYFQDRVQFAPSIDEYNQMLLFDAQTSGGLLLVLPEKNFEAFMIRAREVKVDAWPIGMVVEGQGVKVMDTPFNSQATAHRPEDGLWYAGRV